MSLSLKKLPIQSLQARLQPLQARIQSLTANLKPREKVIIAVAAVVLVIIIIANLIIFPIFDRRTALERKIVSRTNALHEAQQIKSEYEKLTSQSKASEAQIKLRPKTFTLFSFLDTLAGQSGIKKNIIYMKPSSSNLKDSPYSLSLVELKANALTMEQLLKFLHGVETSPNMVWIKRASLTKGDKKSDLLNVILQVETFEL